MFRYFLSQFRRKLLRYRFVQGNHVASRITAKFHCCEVLPPVHHPQDSPFVSVLQSSFRLVFDVKVVLEVTFIKLLFLDVPTESTCVVNSPRGTCFYAQAFMCWFVHRIWCTKVVVEKGIEFVSDLSLCCSFVGLKKKDQK